MRRSLFLVMILALVLVTRTASACPACKDTIAGGDSSSINAGDSDGSGGNVSSGFNLSIYLMFAGLLGVVGLISVTLIRGARGVGQAVAPAPVITQPTAGPVPLDSSSER